MDVADVAYLSHILIVEDEALLRECLLEAVGAEYRVSGASTVREAIAVLRTSHVDAAVIDAVLPDGPSDDVSAFAEQQGVPVIFVSGYPENMFGANNQRRPHLEKPFKLDLLSTLKKVLEGSVQDAGPWAEAALEHRHTPQCRPDDVRNIEPPLNR